MDVRKCVKRSGVYHMPTPYSSDPIPISMDLIQDGEKYSILSMPGTVHTILFSMWCVCCVIYYTVLYVVCMCCVLAEYILCCSLCVVCAVYLQSTVCTHFKC